MRTRVISAQQEEAAEGIETDTKNAKAMAGFVQVRIDSWGEFRQVASQMQGCIYRGQSATAWPLSTSLERVIRRNDLITYRAGMALARNHEHWMLHEFKRKFGVYSTNPPEDNSNVEWLAIMQHHGAPTRLLDFTRSFYIACFFATEASEGDAAVWALSSWSLRSRLKERFKLSYESGHDLKDTINLHHLELANSVIGEYNTKKIQPGVIPFEPRRLTARMMRQQGIFLAPTVIENSFMQNLSAVFGLEETGDPPEIKLNEFTRLIGNWVSTPKSERCVVMKFVLPRTLHGEILRDLRAMNITCETLFPDLDGLARSLVQQVIVR